MHRIMFLLAHICSYTLDHMEPKLEEPTEQAEAEEATNTELTEGRPRCIPPIILGFCFNHYFMLYMLVH
jgi:hypothetical protein